MAPDATIPVLHPRYLLCVGQGGCYGACMHDERVIFQVFQDKPDREQGVRSQTRLTFVRCMWVTAYVLDPRHSA